MLNGIFGYSVSGTGVSGSSTLDAGAAAGTAFAGGPATLPDSDASEEMLTASLPGGAVSYYVSGTATSVWTVAEGAGSVGFLAFDWFENPTPADWEDVLGRMLTEIASPVPEPTTLGIYLSQKYSISGTNA